MNCQVPNCTNTEMRVKNLCNAHYFRMKRYGSYELPPQPQQLLLSQGKYKCPVCNQIKTIDNFHKNKHNKTGITTRCKLCAAIEQKKRDKKQRRRYDLKKKFNMSLEDYNKMLTEQSYVCKICHNANPNKKTLAVDHCHKSNKVRGLLCDCCNRGIGLLQDDPHILQKAIEHLNNFSTKVATGD